MRQNARCVFGAILSCEVETLCNFAKDIVVHVSRYDFEVTSRELCVIGIVHIHREVRAEHAALCPELIKTNIDHRLDGVHPACIIKCGISK